MYTQDNLKINSAVIRVIGVGGGGCNAINSMISSNVKSAEFIAVNTDNQALLMSKAEKCIQIGEKLTKGLGAGSNPSIGEAAAEETKDQIQEVLGGTDLLFIACGMGGGTGTGASSVIARIAHEMGILTVAVVTKPFSFEGRIRNENANKGIANLRKYVDTLVIIPNDKLLQFLPVHIGVLDAFKVADDMLKQGIIGIVELIATPSLINLDFADVSTVMRNQGLAHMGVGKAKGENRVIESVRQAVSSPLLETTIEGAKAVILNVTGGKDLMLSEVNEAATLVQGIIDPSANIIFGATIDETLAEEVKITVIATGFSPSEQSSPEDEPKILKPAPIMEEKEYALPLIQKIEEQEEKEQAVKTIIGNTPVNSEEYVKSKIETVVAEEDRPVAVPEEPVRTEKKGRELPAFMKKLFKR